MMENDIFHCLVERERGEEKWWGPQVFSSPLQNTISPNWRENWSDKCEKYLDKTVPPLFNVYGSFIFSFDFSFVRLAFWFFFFFFLFLWFCQVVGSSSFPSFLFLIFIFIIFLRKCFWMISYSIFWNVHFCLYTILKKNIMYYFLFYLRRTWW